MEIIKSKPQFALTVEDEEFITKAIEFSHKFEYICEDVDDCKDCPLYDACNQVFAGRPDSLVDFFQAILDNSI